VPMRGREVRVRGDGLLVGRRSVAEFTAHALRETELVPARGTVGIFFEPRFQRGLGLVEMIRLALEQREVDVRARQLRIAGDERFELELCFVGVAGSHEIDSSVEIGERTLRNLGRRGRTGRATRTASGRASGTAGRGAARR